MAYFLVLLFVAIAVAVIIVPPRFRRWRRAKHFATPFPSVYREILERNVPLHRKMPKALKQELCGHVNVFLHEKRFFGCGGLQITDEIRVTIAGNACMLLLNRDARYFPGFTSILVYPDTYLVDDVYYDGEVEIRGQDARAGESWQRGPVILSWQDVADNFCGTSNGENVVLHEFAHKLDEENTDVEGLPILADKSQYREWAGVLTRTYESLVESPEAGGDPVFDDYALTAPAEFFAVATESFFEKPREVKQKFPELYSQFSKYYCVDPASW
ncbi:MAG: zinc-dependent peptidase [Woeseiaceae bacterium]